MNQQKTHKTVTTLYLIILILTIGLVVTSVMAYSNRTATQPKLKTMQSKVITMETGLADQQEQYKQLLAGYNQLISAHNEVVASWNREVPTLKEHYTALGRKVTLPDFTNKACLELNSTEPVLKVQPATVCPQ